MARRAAISVTEGALIRSCGPADAPVILCVHGFADDGVAFCPLFNTKLAERFRVVSIDLPGFGASPSLKDALGLDALSDWLARVVDVVANGRPTVLVGHSIGAAIAVEAARHARVDAFISIEGNLVEEDAYLSGRAAQFDDPHAFRADFCDHVWAMAENDPALRRYAGAAMGADAEAMWRLGYDGARVAADGFAQRYEALGVPKTYCWSRATTTAGARARLEASAIQQIEYDVPSHWPMEAAPDAVARDILAFLDTVETLAQTMRATP